MRRRINNLISVFITFFKLSILKILHGSDIKYSLIERFSPNVVVELNRKGRLIFGKQVRIHSGSKIKVRKNGTLRMGDNVRINYNCMFFCRDSITIESGCEFGPNVLIYDHDHDFKCKDGIKGGTYLSAPVLVGENCWIGANSIILRGTSIGANAVIGAGSIVKGNIPAGSILIQKRELM
ncbi:acyltransferase [Enterocloster citroniae]|uniref:acyltransferase n=1 Tax=Enterocloster citroniae TaxID=358743 RepID=UPI00189B5BEF|nr:acyltransferase [Enterocloster citroniae]